MQLMLSEDIYKRYEFLYISLREIIKVSENRVLCELPDKLFIENVNFFVKSYLISICTYLEAYLQDKAYQYTIELDKRIKIANIPNNFVHWRINKAPKDKDLEFKNLNLPIKKIEISEILSGNPYKTIKLFRYLGIDLTASQNFDVNKDLISAVINKRNSIIHHNDKAMDISFSDLLSYIDVFLLYIKGVEEAVSQ